MLDDVSLHPQLQHSDRIMPMRGSNSIIAAAANEH
jgi:hypothetical protein